MTLIQEQFLQDLGIDVQRTLERFGGMWHILEKFLLKFPEDPTFREFKDAQATKNSELLERTAHTLKGLSANLGIQQLSDLCATCVNAIRQDDLQTAFGSCPQIEEEYQRVVGIIHNYSDSMDLH